MSVLASRLRQKQFEDPSQPAVRRTAEFRRIEALPRRTEVLDLREAMTAWLKTPTGSMKLNFEQAWGLSELLEAPGLLGHLEVGAGKTLLTLLAPTVVQKAWELDGRKDKVRAGLIVPANLRNEKTLKVDVPFYGKHFQIYDWHEDNVLSYQQLGRQNYAGELERRMFNMLVFDEAHWLKNQKSAVGLRVGRYLERYPDIPVVAVTGSLTKERIADFGHIARMTLGEGSPLPIPNQELAMWGKVLDHGLEDAERIAPGALRFFCSSPEETVREGFRRRLVETPNVIVSRESDLATGLVITERKLKTPPPAAIGQWLTHMRKTKKTPSGDVILHGLEMASHRKELLCGFFYRWAWPDGTPDLEWLAARKAWRKFVRKCIKDSGLSSVGGLLLDSEKQVRDAVLGGLIECDEGQWEDWAGIKDKHGPTGPPLQTVWVSEYLIDEIERWMDESKTPGLVWVSHNAVLNKLRKRGRRVYGGGQNDVVTETNTCALSLAAHKEGKNLQAFSRNLYVCPPMSGLAWEQSIGRTHRTGQQADEVTVEMFLHGIDLWVAFRNAREESAYVRELIGTKPRLERATIMIPDEQEIVSRSKTTPVDPLWEA